MAEVQVYSDIRTKQTHIILDMRELEELIQEMPERAEKIVRSTAFQAEGYMKKLAAVDTGAMMNSIYTNTAGHDGYANAEAAAKSKIPGVETAPHPDPPNDFTAHVGPCVEYAYYVEFGTSRMAAQPFVVPGVEMARKDFEKSIPELFK